uniref:Uncharacterized protein n=1 Tax=Chromera velia CCMP2878 TaxID=1169474 RepID=A0A0G4ICA3_9ALVE|eukprot:Cvel_2230.t1-p1 / transcript=Cvel_2230.t1 / gene=Cvel_2230 / organism=Chromera_velia_CCMP2878 / gene_product=hypothetical protein / transcript_product=hypothetical protein / location=Cvel_scaffold86:29441-29647(+) / protein_length=69 / sequence_SO=supercontig / SO=protein_coding / is_pseudo=false
MKLPFWKPEHLRLVVFIGLASPLLYDKAFMKDQLVERTYGRNKHRYADVFHHFINRNALIPYFPCLCKS